MRPAPVLVPVCGGVLGGQIVQYAAGVVGGYGLFKESLELFLGQRYRVGDKAFNAVRDGELNELKELLPRLDGQEIYNELFLEAAGRPGAVGRKMTMLILDSGYTFSQDVYKEACERAVRLVDAEKVALLQEQAPDHGESLPLGFFGELARYAYQWKGVQFIAVQIMEGEKGIKVIAPTPYKKIVDKDGEEQEVLVPRYKVVSTYDVSQTEGKPLPSIATPLIRRICSRMPVSPGPGCGAG